MATIPGVSVQHAIITDECRRGRGDAGAFEEAVARLRAEYEAIVEGWKDQAVQPTYHVVLTYERPQSQKVIEYEPPPPADNPSGDGS